MTYDELMRSILTAQDEMLKCAVEANSVTLNGRRYGKLVENCPPNMKPTIFGMAVKVDYSMPDDYEFLVQYEPPEPTTNADRVRSMSDEELAALCESGCPPRRGCPDLTKEDVDKSYHELCQKCWLDWLKQEAGE